MNNKYVIHNFFEEAFKKFKREIILFIYMNDLHKLSYRNEIIAELQNPRQNKERISVLKMLFPAVESLYSSGIYIFPNVIELFKINGFKKASLYNDAIFNIVSNISEEKKCNLKWITPRTFKKSNAKDKNIILCFFLFIFHETFIKYLNDFLLKNEPKKDKIGNLISILKRTVDNARNNKSIQPSIESIKNKSENEQNPKVEKIENVVIDDLNFGFEANITDDDQFFINDDISMNIDNYLIYY